MTERDSVPDEVLIHHVQNYPAIWDKDHPSYKAPALALTALTRSVGLQATKANELWVKSRWKNIQQRFAVERYKLDGDPTGSAVQVVNHPWHLFPALYGFLRHKYEFRPTIDSFEIRTPPELTAASNYSVQQSADFAPDRPLQSATPEGPTGSDVPLLSSISSDETMPPILEPEAQFKRSPGKRIADVSCKTPTKAVKLQEGKKFPSLNKTPTVVDLDDEDIYDSDDSPQKKKERKRQKAADEKRKIEVGERIVQLMERFKSPTRGSGSESEDDYLRDIQRSIKALPHEKRNAVKLGIRMVICQAENSSSTALPNFRMFFQPVQQERNAAVALAESAPAAVPFY